MHHAASKIGSQEGLQNRIEEGKIIMKIHPNGDNARANCRTRSAKKADGQNVFCEGGSR
jgi:hypothetical protein